jgi:hypothetical protein
MRGRLGQQRKCRHATMEIDKPAVEKGSYTPPPPAPSPHQQPTYQKIRGKMYDYVWRFYVFIYFI